MFTLSNATTFVFCFSLAAFGTGCGSTATIGRVNAPDLEAEIQSSDSESINVKTANTTFSVSRQTITSIDHPGNVAATIGAVVTGYGIANIALGASDCDRGGAAYCTGVFLPAAIGLPVMAYGLYNWLSSTRAANMAKPKNDAALVIVPTISTDKKSEYVGVSAATKF